MGDVRIYHPVTGGEATVAASAVPILAGSGWRPVEGQEDMGDVLPPELAPFEGQPIVRMRHPDLDAAIIVAESAVPQHRSNGWLLVEDEPKVEPSAVTFEGFTVEQLRDEARARGLAVSGTKAELLGRLADTDQQTEDQAEPEAAEPSKEGE